MPRVATAALDFSAGSLAPDLQERAHNPDSPHWELYYGMGMDIGLTPSHGSQETLGLRRNLHLTVVSGPWRFRRRRQSDSWKDREKRHHQHH